MPHEHHEHATLLSTPTRVTHPLDPLTAWEFEAGRQVLVDAGRVGATTRFPNVLPVEPSKETVATFAPGEPIERRLLFVLLDTATGSSAEAVVSITARQLVSYTPLNTAQPPYGQPQYLFEEYDAAARIAKADPGWQSAMARRGLADRIEHAFCAPLAPGFFGREDESATAQSAR